jgi:hypothetical protein
VFRPVAEASYIPNNRRVRFSSSRAR